jgi:hypothetical protein
VDHFIPWSRYPDNGIHNLVVADERCNRWKRDFLAARQHVLKWRRRNTEYESALVEVAGESKWVSHPDETLGVARGIYIRLPSRARLWLQEQDFCLVGPEPLEPLLA